MLEKNDTYITRETLVKRLSEDRGTQAWEEFVHLYERFIYSVIRKMGISTADTEDIQQKVLLKIWQSIPNFELNQRKGAFRNWIKVIAVRTTYTFMKKEKRIDQKNSNASLFYEDFMGRGGSVDDYFEEEWKLNIVQLAFKKVSQNVSALMIEIFQAHSRGESAESISARLDIPIRSIYRYRQKVIQLLTDEISALKEVMD